MWDSQSLHIVGSHFAADIDCKVVGENQFDHMVLLLGGRCMSELLVHDRKLAGSSLRIVDKEIDSDIEVDSDKALGES